MEEYSPNILWIGSFADEKITARQNIVDKTILMSA